MSTVDLGIIIGVGVTGVFVGLQIAALARESRLPKGQDFDEPVMHVECAWCHRYLGTKECAPEYAGKVSHGACPECARKMASEAKEKA